MRYMQKVVVLGERSFVLVRHDMRKRESESRYDVVLLRLVYIDPERRFCSVGYHMHNCTFASSG